MKKWIRLVFLLLISNPGAQSMGAEDSILLIDSYPTTLENPADWELAGFKDTLAHEVNLTRLYSSDLLGSNTYTHFFNLDFIRLRGTSWTEADIKTHLFKTAKIYTQCLIKIGRVRIFETEHQEIPANYLYRYGDSDAVITRRESHFAELVPTQNRPLIFLFEDLKEKGLYDLQGNRFNFAALSYTEDAIRLSRIEGVSPKIVGMTLMSSEVNTERYLDRRPKEFGTLAHEIGHVLGPVPKDSGIRFNLMSDYDGEVNGQIGKFLCEKFRRSPLVQVIP